jgi:tetratricopeptide (TPR) repeat protein
MFDEYSHSTRIDRLRTEGLWTGLVRYWLAHSNNEALQAAMDIVEQDPTERGQSLHAWLTSVQKSPINHTLEMPEWAAEALGNCSSREEFDSLSDEVLTVVIVAHWPYVFHVEFLENYPEGKRKAIAEECERRSMPAIAGAMRLGDKEVQAKLLHHFARTLKAVDKIEESLDVHREVIERYEKLMRLRPGHYAWECACAWSSKGNVEIASRDLHAARKSLEQAISLHGEGEESTTKFYKREAIGVRLNLGQVLMMLHEYPPAATQFQSALEILDGEPELEQSFPRSSILRHLLEAQLNQEKDHVPSPELEETAAGLQKEAEMLGGASAEYLFQLVSRFKYLMTVRKWEDARVVADKILGILDGNEAITVGFESGVELRLHAGHLYLELGELEKARSLILGALEQLGGIDKPDGAAQDVKKVLLKVDGLNELAIVEYELRQYGEALGRHDLAIEYLAAQPAGFKVELLRARALKGGGDCCRAALDLERADDRYAEALARLDLLSAPDVDSPQFKELSGLLISTLGNYSVLQNMLGNTEIGGRHINRSVMLAQRLGKLDFMASHYNEGDDDENENEDDDVASPTYS